MEEKKLTCIGCPLGCQINVKIEEHEILEVAGNTCKRGEEYAKKEIYNPTRIVTTTVKVKHGNSAMVSVKTASDIPKDKIVGCMQALKNIEVTAPVAIGDVIVENVAETGVNIVATRNVEKRCSS